MTDSRQLGAARAQPEYFPSLLPTTGFGHGVSGFANFAAKMET
jgi:hypothetical protein